MRVFVAGASGAIGRVLVMQLAARGHHVTATTRTPAKAGGLRELGAEPVVMNGLDSESVAEAVARAEPEVIVHQMTALAAPGMRALRPVVRAHQRAADEGPGAPAGRRRGRRVHASCRTELHRMERTAARAAGEAEDGPAGPAAGEPRSASRWPPSSYLEQAVADAPLEGVALRYGSLYGPGASESVSRS